MNVILSEYENGDVRLYLDDGYGLDFKNLIYQKVDVEPEFDFLFGVGNYIDKEKIKELADIFSEGEVLFTNDADDDELLEFVLDCMISYEAHHVHSIVDGEPKHYWYYIQEI
jgi:hypothetical protein